MGMVSGRSGLGHVRPTSVAAGWPSPTPNATVPAEPALARAQAVTSLPTGQSYTAETPIDPPDEDVPDLSELPADVPDQRIDPEDDAAVEHEAPTEEPA